MKPREAMMRDAARGSWAPRVGLGSFLRQPISYARDRGGICTHSNTKNGLRDKTTDSEWLR